MLSLDELLHPVTPAEFLADYYGRKPLHIPAQPDGTRRELLTWDAYNYLLDQQGIWTSQSLRPMRDHIPVHPDQYCRTLQTVNGSVKRPWTPKLEVFVAAGSSLVANEVHHLHPPLTRLGAMLGEAFGAGIGSNVYFSSKGIRAFGTHFDNHEVFAIQTEGEKVWNIYEHRADNPAISLPDNMETRRWFERTRGPLMTQVEMKPGDLLYLPRGQYHDALATTGPSLHVTFAVNPQNGQAVVALLEKLAAGHALFRDWLPTPRTDDSTALKVHLQALGALLSDLVQSDGMVEELAKAHQRQLDRPAGFSLPELPPLTMYRTTGRAFPATRPALRAIYDWAIAERQFAAEDMVATFESFSASEVRSGLEAAERAGAVEPL